MSSASKSANSKERKKKSKQFDYTFKIVMIGDSGVGKSCILLRFADDKFNENFYATIGVDFRFKNITVDNKSVKLQIVSKYLYNKIQWDTAGQERFKTITSAYYRGAHGIIIVYDVSDKKSFIHIKDWLEDINKYTDNNPIKLIVGNKCDLTSEKQVTEEDKKALKKQTGIDIIETSAKNSFKITEAMEMITKKLIEKNGQGGENNTDIGNDKKGISLDNKNQDNNNGTDCCSFSF